MGREQAGGNGPEAFGLGLGRNKEANEGEEKQMSIPGRKLPPLTAVSTQFLVNPEAGVCVWGLAIKTVTL